MHSHLRGTVVFGNGTRDKGQKNRILYFLLNITGQSLNSSLFFLACQTAFLFPCGVFLALENHEGVLSKYSQVIL